MARIPRYLFFPYTSLFRSSFSLSDIVGILTFTPKHEREENKLIRRYARKMYNEKHLVLAGSGGKQVRCIEIISLDFDSIEKLSLEETRCMMVECVEELLEKINANAILRPHLESYPFTSKNLDFMIGFLKQVGYHVNEPYIAFASLSEGTIRYFVALDDNHTKILTRESYEDA